MNGNSKQIIELLERIINRIKLPGTDTAWSWWDTPTDAINFFSSAIEKLKNNDTEIISELEIIFGPTASLQELAISSGWGDKYLELASEFDDLIANN